MKQFNKTKPVMNLFLRTLVLAGVAAGTSAMASSITEPPTTFYGKVIGVGGEQPFLLQEGDLDWTIQRADGSDLQIATYLYPVNDGTMSYVIEIPHTAQAAGLSGGSGIPMPPTGATNEHALAMVSGVKAEFIGPSGSYFEVGQNSRAATYRLDLMVDIDPTDSDGDGIPDWWEDLHGLDKNNPADALLDLDGDGIINLDEYLFGFDPNADNRNPGLLTKEVLVYIDKVTGLRLKSSDADSAAEEIVYTLSVVPDFGNLVLRNAVENTDNPDTALTVGSTFTQAQVDAGRLVFEQSDDISSTNVTEFSVVVQDENSESPAVEAAVSVSFYEPVVGDIQLTDTGTLRKKAHDSGLMIWDAVLELSDVTINVPTTGMSDSEYAAYQLNYGAESGQYILGGRGDDTLRGGMVDDVLLGRQGENILTGGGGADSYVFNAEASGTNRVTDFSATDVDVLDLAGKLAGATGLVDEYVQFIPTGLDTWVQIDDLTVVLENLLLNASDSYSLVADGLVNVGGLKLLPRLNVRVTDAVASENGNNSGVFTIEREGDWAKAMTAQFVLGGVAVNAVDYSSVDLAVDFAAGQKSVDVVISPFADGTSEGDEAVELVLTSDATYLIGSADRGVVTIKDLQAVVGIEVVEALATTDPVSPGLVLVTRNGQTDSSLFVLLTVGGTASSGSDYQLISSYLNFAPNQVAMPIEIMPFAGAILDGGAEVVDIAVKANSAYALGDVSSARVTLVGRRDSLAQWQAREFPDSTDSPAIFAEGDAGDTGVDHLQRYAYGMDPLDPDAARLPQIVWRDGHMTVDVYRNPEATDVTVVADVSNDLKTWSASEVMIRRITALEHVHAADIETYQVVPLKETEAQRFVRIRVIYNP